MKKQLAIALVLASLQAFSQQNFSLGFNGSSSKVSIAQALPANCSYTKEAWVYATQTSGAHNIVSSQNHPFWISGGVLKAGQAGNYTQVSDTRTFPLNAWTHVAVTYHAATTTMQLYVNGQLVSSNASVPAYTAEPVFIGSHSGAGGFFTGQIDEVRIWKTVRTAAEIKSTIIKQPAGSATGLVAWFPFIDGGGSMTSNMCTNPDASPSGTITAGSWMGSPVDFAPNAVQFNGSNNYIDLGTSPTLKPSTTVTVEGWFKAADWATIPDQYLVNNFEQGGYGLKLGDGKVQFAYYKVGAADYTFLTANVSGLGLTNNTWAHIAATYSGTGASLYVNGNLVNTSSWAPSANIHYAHANSMLIGANPDAASNPTGSYFNGAVDEVRIWNTVRTQAEIQQAMNKELDPANAAQTTGLISYYTFNQGTAGGDNTGLSSVVDIKGNNTAQLKNFTLNGGASNYVAQQASMVVLPLQWLSFTADQKSSAIHLTWIANTEGDGGQFLVQHSRDNRQWNTVGTVAAHAGSEAREYQYQHVNTARGAQYYRLAHRSATGQMQYSATRLLKLDGRTKSFTVAGNRVRSELVLIVQEAGVYRLINPAGDVLLQQVLTPGRQVIQLPALPKGMYLITNTLQTEKFLIN